MSFPSSYITRSSLRYHRGGAWRGETIEASRRDAARLNAAPPVAVEEDGTMVLAEGERVRVDGMDGGKVRQRERVSAADRDGRVGGKIAGKRRVHREEPTPATSSALGKLFPHPLPKHLDVIPPNVSSCSRCASSSRLATLYPPHPTMPTSMLNESGAPGRGEGGKVRLLLRTAPPQELTDDATVLAHRL